MLRNHPVRYGLLSLLLCVSILVSAAAFPLHVIALTAPQSSGTEALLPSGDVPSPAGADDGSSAVPHRKSVELAATGDGAMTGAADAKLYTDRSGNIGVSSEGYTDATANVDVHASGLQSDPDVLLGSSLLGSSLKRTGGTLYLERENTVLGNTFIYYINQQLWDGKAPIRVTGEGHTIYIQANENDFMLEDDEVLLTGTVYPPNFSIKLDHLTYRSLVSNQNFWARGNKIVFGEGFETASTGGAATIFRIFGGAEHQTQLDGPKTIYPTNIVVESGGWDQVFGGGQASTAYGTNVTVRGDADIEAVYGGGDDECQVAVYDQDAVNGDASLKGVGANVYIEGGTVANLYGGSRISTPTLLGQLVDNKKLNVYTPVSVNISGGHVTNVYAMSDFTPLNGKSAATAENYIRGSYIKADATVNISAADSADYVVGDLFRNYPVSAANQRHVLGTTRANITASNAFERLNYFDVINISGSGVVVSANEVIGGAMTDNSITTYGPSFDGYVGQIAVTNGAKLVLDHRGIINNYYNNPLENNSAYQETDRVIQDDVNYDDAYCLSHGFVGETSEARRSLSVVSINGATAGITAASGTSFDEENDVCGLLIHGTVQGSLGSAGSYGNTTAGYSTLEVTGTPLYSDADDYYYYIVADSSVNGGVAFREPENAPYIVCYRYLEDGRIGWYLREKPSLSMSNKLVRTGDASNGEMVLSVTMNSFGYEWNSAAAQNHVDFQIAKTTGTSGSESPVSDNLSPAVIAGIRTDSSGRFRNVVTATESGVEYLVSFDCVVDTSTPVDPTYYAIEADYHVVRDSGAYNDVHAAKTADAARCVYDFAGNDNLHSSGGYADSIMTTFPYGSSPAGADTALLRVYLPYGVSGSLNVAENDDRFRFTTDASFEAQLDAAADVASGYTTATQAYANSHFGVTIGGEDLAGGVSKTLSSAVSTYACAVSSYQNLALCDISQLTASGLQLRLTVSRLTKNGSAVGAGSPYADNNGELQIQTVGAYKIIYHYTTRTQGDKVFVVKGRPGDASVDASGHLTDAFILSMAPYESNHGETLVWSDASINHSFVNGVLTASINAQQSAQMMGVHYRLTESGAYTDSFMAPIGANRQNNANVANLTAEATVDGKAFKYWEIRKSGDSSAPVIARCTDAEFSYCIMDHYWIAPVYADASAGSNSARLNPDALKAGNEDWLAWTFNDGEAGTLITPSDDLTFNGLKDKVIFIRIAAGETSLGTNWANVWNQTDDLTVEDGKTFVLTSYSQEYGNTKMYGEWTDTIILTHIDYSRNRWTDSEGNLSANGRSDYLYSDFEIAFKSGEDDIYQNESCRTGMVFELCGLLGEEDTFTPDAYTYRSDPTNLKAAILSGASGYTTGGSTRRIQCSSIATSALTNKNRIEFAKSYYNTSTNANAIMKVTAYLIDGDNHVTLSNPVYICLRSVSLMDLTINVSP